MEQEKFDLLKAHMNEELHGFDVKAEEVKGLIVKDKTGQVFFSIRPAVYQGKEEKYYIWNNANISSMNSRGATQLGTALLVASNTLDALNEKKTDDSDGQEG